MEAFWGALVALTINGEEILRMLITLNNCYFKTPIWTSLYFDSVFWYHFFLVFVWKSSSRMKIENFWEHKKNYESIRIRWEGSKKILKRGNMEYLNAFKECQNALNPFETLPRLTMPQRREKVSRRYSWRLFWTFDTEYLKSTWKVLLLLLI